MNIFTDNTTSLNVNESDITNVTASTENVSSTEPRNTIVPDSLITQARFWIYVVIIPVFCTCGIVGNSLAVIVFTEIVRKLKQSIYRYILALVSVDSFILVLALVRAVPYITEAIDKGIDKDEENGEYWQAFIIIPIVYVDLNVTTMNSMILILMSLERLVAIRTPLVAKQTLLAKHPNRIMSAVAVIVMLCMLPLPISLQVTQSVNLNGSSSYNVVYRENMEQFMHYFVLIQTALLRYVPYVTLMLLNVAIPVQYAVASRARLKTFSTTIFHTSIENNQFQSRINATTSIIIFMYTLLNFPQMFVQTLSVIDEAYSINGAEDNVFWLMTDISNVLLIVNSSVDFLIYVLRTETYRARFKEKFCSRKPPTSSTDSIFEIA